MQRAIKQRNRSRKSIFALGLLSVVVLVFSRSSSLQSLSAQGPFGGPPQSIAFQSNRDGNNEIYVMSPDGSDQTRLTLDLSNDQKPDISPNGRQIVFASKRTTVENPEGDFEIFIMNSDGSDVRELTFNNADDSWPRWSPNGQWIAFHSNVNGNYEIYIIRPDATDLTRVTDYPGLDQFPDWSPNGKQLAIRRDSDVYVIDIDGCNPSQLTTTQAPAFDQMPSWSPDGKQIAFLSTRDGYPSIYMTDADGSTSQSDQRNLTRKPDLVPASMWTSRAPAWSRNGQNIYFTGRRPVTGTIENIWVMNADSLDVTPLTSIGTNVEAAVR